MKRYRDDVEACFVCEVHDEDVEKCVVNGCWTYLHKHCGAQCEGCGKVVCQEHKTEFDDEPVCPICLAELYCVRRSDRVAAD